MYVLVILAVVVTTSGTQPLTRPEIEYYTSKEQCAKYGEKHIKEFLQNIGQEPALLAAKCVKVGELDGDPA